MKASEIKELTVAEIQEKVEAAKADMLRMKLAHTVSPVENTTSIRATRRDIARMLTVLRQKQNN